MNIKDIILELRDFEGAKRKNEIRDVVKDLKFSDNDYPYELISTFGDDAAVIGIDNENVILLAADGIWEKLIISDPWWAGYCSVLVNANDIAAMGGKSIGMTNVIGFKDKKIEKKILCGIKDGIDKFGIPMVGGHTHPDSSIPILSVSITGICKKDSVIFSNGAKVGDKVVFAYDLDGRIYKNFSLNWDTTTMKSKKLVREQLDVLNKIGEMKLVNSCKDISNPGALGTLGMLLEVSNVGAKVCIDKIPKNEDIPLIQWLKMYPGCGFVFTLPEENFKELKEILEDVNISSKICGEIINDKKLVVSYKGQKGILYDFNNEYICGCIDG